MSAAWMLMNDRRIIITAERDICLAGTNNKLYIERAPAEDIRKGASKHLSGKEAEKHTCRYGRTYDTRNIRTHGMHEQVVGGIIFKTEVI